MPNKKNDPLGMVEDPFLGDTFIFPDTDCTRERRHFLSRNNDILRFLYITRFSYNIAHNSFLDDVGHLPKKDRTPIRISVNSDENGSEEGSVTLPAGKILKYTYDEGINVVTRQSFIMFYGSFETYLFQLCERSYAAIGVKDDVKNNILEILMRRRWDGKFSKMNEEFNLGYKANHLVNHFRNFQVFVEGKEYKNPLDFLDAISEVRHRIIHASSILEEDKLITVNFNIFGEFHAFYFHLTDYVDRIFSKRFGFPRNKINPADPQVSN